MLKKLSSYWHQGRATAVTMAMPFMSSLASFTSSGLGRPSITCKFSTGVARARLDQHESRGLAPPGSRVGTA